MSDPQTHEQFEQRDAVKSSTDRAFGFVFTVVFTVIGLAPLIGGDAIRIWSMVIAAVFLALSLIHPETMAPLNRLWTKFGTLLHCIVSPLVMALLFFLVVTPIGLLMRAFGKRPLNIGLDHAATSYWIDREPPGPAPETMKQQF
ncbi:MAG: hypothetical protein HOK21_22905 [Rhodospirillaceae bacterium]|jgi:hypothetical protein|nr:hypothetical protein [Rhodospirillaceae bacterium]MBT5081504.1 hypothetical protein [Rhodospirillaceae bacterium]MBT5526946.1 hypothetical protein [Rhodospirillaceae bacterium]MBT5881842.1 hypothetical protein [Rhodospirillaceae bacterium]MBT6587547.1 hypothetical protein [Rhodospirillaceae bacterium]